jgi:hypothetical protein
VERVVGRHSQDFVLWKCDRRRLGNECKRLWLEPELSAALGECRIGPCDRSGGADAVAGGNLDFEALPLVPRHFYEGEGLSEQRWRARRLAR